MLTKNLHIKQLEQKIAQLEEECLKLKKRLSESESEKKYQSLFEMSDDAILVIENNKFVDCNQAVVRMLRYNSKEEFLNTHPAELSPKKQPDGRLSYEKAQEIMGIVLEKGSHHFEWIHTRADGENFPVEVWLSRVDFNERVCINTIWRDLTAQKKSEATIHKSIKEKDILLKEVHHRVKNNLQIINSLLNLQASTIENKQAISILMESKSRIEAMCKVHEMLYSSNDFSNINYTEYLNELFHQLIDNQTDDDFNISYDIVANHLNLNVNTAIPLGLIINEMVTNSLKYAFVNKSSGKITIRMKELNDETLELNYSDNGIAYPASITFENAKTLGLQLILALVHQLHGSITRNVDFKGTSYRFLIKRFS